MATTRASRARACSSTSADRGMPGASTLGMRIRSIAFVLGSLALSACDSSGSAAADESKATTSGGNAIDGTWDVTAAGIGTLGVSEMTIKGGDIRGVLVNDDEGLDLGDSCTLTKSRDLFKFTVSGDKLTGTITHERAFSSPACGDAQSEAATVSATRKHAAKNAQGATVLEGEWVVKVEGRSPLAVAVTGLAGKAWDQAAKAKGDAPALTTLVTNGEANTTADDTRLSFAARKR